VKIERTFWQTRRALQMTPNKRMQSDGAKPRR
jgi:hypothetical protein